MAHYGTILRQDLGLDELLKAILSPLVRVTEMSRLANGSWMHMGDSGAKFQVRAASDMSE